MSSCRIHSFKSFAWYCACFLAFYIFQCSLKGSCMTMSSHTSVHTVFVRTKDIPDSESIRPTVLKICLAADRETGQGTVLGAQDFRGLWRVYSATAEARSQLLLKGLRIRKTLIQPSSTNPFLFRDDTGEEKPATKVWVDNIPISVADPTIEEALVKAGCELRSPIKLERARDNDSELTRFLTGRRFLFITLPPRPLEKTLRVNIFTTKLVHKEQRQVTVFCSRCLTQGHHISVCTSEIVCRMQTDRAQKRR